MFTSLINLTIDELNETGKTANSSTLAKVNQIKKAIGLKKPDNILSSLQKSGDLSKYFDYWQPRSCQDPEDIKSTFKGGERLTIHVLIDQHILKLISGEPSKITWTNPNIINPQAHQDPIPPQKSESIENKNPKWLSQAGLADVLGVSRQAIQKLCRPGAKFEPALNDKRKINRWHPIIVQHKADLDARNINGRDPIQKSEPGQKSPAVIPAQVKNSFNMQITFEDVEHLTLKQIVETYGGVQGFKNYMEALEKMSGWKTKEQKYLKERNQLIEKEPTAKSLFSIVNMMLSRIVNETPSSIIDQLFAIAKGKKKTARIDAIKLMQETLSKIIKDAKKELVRDLKKLED